MSVHSAEFFIGEDPDFRTGVRTWDEVPGHIELVYQEWKDNKYEDVACLSALNKEDFLLLMKAGNSLFDLMENK